MEYRDRKPQLIRLGMLQNLLVSVPSMYWPSVLVTVQLFTTLYPTQTQTATAGQTAVQRQLVTKRFQVFLLVFVGTFTYQFFPMLLFPTLTSVATLCLINNQSWWMRTLGSGYNGAGLWNFSFDWSSIGTSGPLYTPYWALGNYYGGLIVVCWIVGIVFFLVVPQGATALTGTRWHRSCSSPTSGKCTAFVTA